MSCALYGSCGRTSIFTPELPCVGPFPAKPLPEDVHTSLEKLCGPMPRELCCSEQQVADLETNLAKAEAIIGGCPACHKNFVELWCQFTCSPQQSAVVDVTATKTSMDGRAVPAQVDFWVSEAFGDGLYDSCKNVTFSATNGRAMDLIGGGARNAGEFLRFLGEEKPMLGGSAFEIDFPVQASARKAPQFVHTGAYDHEPQFVHADLDADAGASAGVSASPYPNADAGAYNLASHATLDSPTFNCSHPDYRCPCTDCPSSCPSLPALDPPQSCSMWGINCMSLFILVIYALSLLLLGALYFSIKRHRDDSLPIVEDDEDTAATDPLLPVRSTKTLPTYRINTLLQTAFQRLGYFCARFPLLVMTLCSLFVLVSSLGLFGIELLDDPAELWVGPNSREAQEKADFESNFGMFYRTQQLFVVNETGPVLQDYATVEWLFDVEDRVRQLHCNLTQDSLEDFCFEPLGKKGGCVVESISSYFGGNLRRIPESSWKPRLRQCLRSPVSCLPTFQQPINPELVLGDYDEDPLETSTLVTTWLLNNHKDPAYLGRVEIWEQQIEELFAHVSEEAAARGLRVSYNLESSLSRELTKSSVADIKIIVLSYVLMFLYASLSLGGRLRQRDPFINTKFSLGLGGIIIVLLSVVSSIGVCSSLGIKLTLIITEVIPFLVLAVGVDNIYLLVHDLELVNDLYPQFTIEERVAKAVGLIGPSIFLSSTCEIVAILIGVRVSMPAVHNFAIYSGVAVLINSVLQLTMFVSAMTLNQYRIQARRIDCLPCLRAPDADIDPDESDLNFIEVQEDNRHFSMLIRSITPYLFKRSSKLAVVAAFVLWLAISLSVIPSIEMGLDQRFAVPQDSFLVDYFTDVGERLRVGPPVYFVVEGATVEQRGDQQRLCGRFSTCDEFSLVNVIEQERKRPDVSYLSVGAASWIDDFLGWLNPGLDCCFEDGEGLCEPPFVSIVSAANNANEANEASLPVSSYSASAAPASAFASAVADCHRCYANRTYDPYMNGFPEDEEFDHYAKLWLSAPSSTCPLAGKAPYGNAVAFADGRVSASHFRSQHVPLRSQSDYINAYAAARRISSDLSRSGLEVYPYSVFYVYFAQYHSLVGDTLSTLGVAFVVVFILSTLLLGSARTGGVVTATVLIMLCNICGLMQLVGVSLNALSLVNLLICVGIGVEFCIHIARAFTFVHKVNALALQGFSKTERAFNALAGTGGTVFGGIAVTKLIGVVVLGLAKSKIFEVYYFRMWLALVFCATLHSLVLLPVLLSVVGGGAYLLEDGEQFFREL